MLKIQKPLLFILLLQCCAGLFAEDTVSLEQAIIKSVEEIENTHKSGNRVAVLHFDTSSPEFSDYIIEELMSAILKGHKLIVTERKNLDAVRKELNFHASGDVSDKTAASIGKMVGAQVVITGELIDIGRTYRFRIIAINVEAAIRTVAISLNVLNDSRIKKLQTALQKNPRKQIAKTHSKSKIPQTAGDYLERGIEFYERADYDIAIAEFTDAIKLDTNFSVAYSHRGRAEWKKATSINIASEAEQEYNKAIEDCTQAIRLDPNSAFAYNYRGNAYSGKKDYVKAFADYNMAIRLDPNFAAAYSNRGNAYRDKKDDVKALADYNMAIKLDPNFAAAYINRGDVYRAGKIDYDKAIEDYSQAIKIDPNYARAYNNRGNAYYNKDNYRQAILDYTQALKLNPNYEDAKIWLENAKKMVE
ncbi:MAG: hypothetical protein Ta2G_08340 [Termitinemataceae bacterium]|nr:MAG: hypothetical protein Ta2G_08340 [Termitinemataceae bacterium]